MFFQEEKDTSGQHIGPRGNDSLRLYISFRWLNDEETSQGSFTFFNSLRARRERERERGKDK